MIRIRRAAGISVLVGLIVAAFALSPANAGAPAFDLGFHIPQGDSRHLGAAAEAGAGFVVVVFSWRDIEPVEGYWYWEQPDAVLRGAEHYGLEVIARLDRPPDWALSGSAIVPWRTDAYARFAAQTAARYGDRLAGVIIRNEPNLALEWNGQEPDPAGYAAMLRAAYQAVKGVAPELPVAMAGLAFTIGDGTNAVNDLDYMQSVYANGGGAYFDALALHPYGFGQPPEAEPSAGVLNFRRLELHRRIMEENGDAGKPAWITETGWRTSAPQPEDGWQVVTPERQAGYSVRAMEWAAREYTWLERLAFWEINGGIDEYGYALWQGPGKTTPAYRAIAGWAEDKVRPQIEALADDAWREGALPTVEILAADTIVRLGEVGTLHPHWVHLHRSDGQSSLTWSGEFYLPPGESAHRELLMETMQVDDPSNDLYMNGAFLARLQRRPRLDSTSTWVTQRFPVPADLLRPGPNVLEIRSGPRNPVRQNGGQRYENFQVRNIRLAAVEQSSAPLWDGWQRLESPGSWAEINRLRFFRPEDGRATSLWVTSNANGGLWAASPAGMRGGFVLENEAGNRADLVFVDVLATAAGEIAATDRGLYWRASGTPAWLPVPGAPEAYAYVVAPVGGRVLAGFEGQGIWSSAVISDSWQLDGLDGRSVLDLAASGDGTVYAATDAGVFRKSGRAWLRMPSLPAEAYQGRHGAVADDFIGRLDALASGAPVVLKQRMAWVWEDGWRPYGPAELQGAIFDVSVGADGTALLASDRKGLWAQESAGEWRRLDGGFLDALEVVGGLVTDELTFAATTAGLMIHGSGDGWSVAEGMTSTVTDVEIVAGSRREPTEPSVWLAGTQTGVYRSTDQGARWERISPPWAIWDLAWDGARLYAGRRQGLAWTDTPLVEEPVWHETEGLNGVTFFRIHPDRFDADVVWGGTWGNSIGVSEDRGRTIAPLNNGLETLSALDIWQHETPGQYTIGTIEGLYRTDDGGETWFKLPGPLERQTVYAVLQTADGLLWAGVADGLWRSADYGVTWSRAGDLPAGTVLRVGTTTQGGSPLMWAATEGRGLWISKDGGRSWTPAGLDGLTVFTVAPDGEGSLLAATAQGLYGVGPLLNGEGD